MSTNIFTTFQVENPKNNILVSLHLHVLYLLFFCTLTIFRYWRQKLSNCCKFFLKTAYHPRERLTTCKSIFWIIFDEGCRLPADHWLTVAKSDDLQRIGWLIEYHEWLLKCIQISVLLPFLSWWPLWSLVPFKLLCREKLLWEYRFRTKVRSAPLGLWEFLVVY